MALDATRSGGYALAVTGLPLSSYTNGLNAEAFSVGAAAAEPGWLEDDMEAEADAQRALYPQPACLTWDCPLRRRAFYLGENDNFRPLVHCGRRSCTEAKPIQHRRHSSCRRRSHKTLRRVYWEHTRQPMVSVHALIRSTASHAAKATRTPCEANGLSPPWLLIPMAWRAQSNWTGHTQAGRCEMARRLHSHHAGQRFSPVVCWTDCLCSNTDTKIWKSSLLHSKHRKQRSTKEVYATWDGRQSQPDL